MTGLPIIDAIAAATGRTGTPTARQPVPDELQPGAASARPERSRTPAARTALLWTQKQDIGPSARDFPSMTFDAARQRVVLFGGQLANGELRSDTWSWDGTDWTQLADIGPPPRVAAAIAFDAARQRVVLAGGFPTAGTLTDTWEWDGAEWTQLADTGPDARAMHAMAYDAGRKQVVLFGGLDNANNVLGDTWAWDGTEWTQLADAGPQARALPAMTFDAAARHVLLFGGMSSPPTNAMLGDTWAWDGVGWTELAQFGPPAAAAASIECDGRTVLLFGGGIATSNPTVAFGGTWQWDGRHWIQRQDMGPHPRLAAGVAFDSARHRYVLFGGAGAPPADSTDTYISLGDTWETFDPPAVTSEAQLPD